jgi:hypothetical protein
MWAVVSGGMWSIWAGVDVSPTGIQLTAEAMRDFGEGHTRSKIVITVAG